MAQPPRNIFAPVRSFAGMTLLELVAALTIAATVAALGIHYLKPTGTVAHQRSCDLTRELLQNDCERYFDINGRLPRTDLRELQSSEFSGDPVPHCPSTGERYRLNRSGRVECPAHR